MKFIKRKKSKFYKEFYRINLPIFISQLFLVTMGIFNSIIFGQLGERVLASIAIVDKLNSVYWPIIAAIATVMTIYFVQFSGVNNQNKIKSVFILSNLLMIGISILVFLLICLFGKKAITLYTKETIIISDAFFYLWFIGFSNIIATGTYSLITYFNGMGKVKETSGIAIIQTLVNFILYYIFIIKINSGFLYGIKGIAVAITITKILEFFIYFRIYNKNFLLENLKFDWEDIKELKGIDKKIFPLIFNNLMFMIASNIIFIAYSKMGTTETAAIGITDGLIGFFSLLILGIITSSKIMIGSLLGKNRMKLAYVYALKFIKIMIFSSTICFILMNIISTIYLKFYKININTMNLSISLIFIASLFFTAKMLNSLIVDGILRMGGDIRATLINDLSGIFIFGVLVSVIFTKFIKIDIKILYILISFNEVFRLFLNYKRFLERKWLKNSLNNRQ